MDYFVTDKDTFDRIREDWLDMVRNDNFENIDVPLIPVLKMFNTLPGIASFMSCMSHPEEFALDKKNYTARYRDFYITFAFTEEGLFHIQRLFSLLRSQVRKTWPRHVGNMAGPRMCTLSFGSRGSKGKDKSDLDDDYWWNSGCLGMGLSTTDPSVRDTFIHMLNKCLLDYLLALVHIRTGQQILDDSL